MFAIDEALTRFLSLWWFLNMAKAPNIFNIIAVDFCWLCQDQRVQWWRKSSVRHKQISGVRYYIRAINLGGLWNHIFQPICTVFLQLFGLQTPINSVNIRWSWWIDWPEEIDSGNGKHEVKEWQSSLKFMVCETRWTVFFRTLHLNLKLSAPPRFRLPIVIA